MNKKDKQNKSSNLQNGTKEKLSIRFENGTMILGTRETRKAYKEYIKKQLASAYSKISKSSN